MNAKDIIVIGFTTMIVLGTLVPILCASAGGMIHGKPIANPEFGALASDIIKVSIGFVSAYVMNAVTKSQDTK